MAPKGKRKIAAKKKDAIKKATAALNRQSILEPTEEILNKTANTKNIAIYGAAKSKVFNQLHY